jgi:hypothetical protein
LEDFQKSSGGASAEQFGEVVDWLPSSITFVLEDDGAELQSVFGINMARGAKALRWIASNIGDDSGAVTHEYGDFEIFEPDMTVNVSTSTELDEFGLAVEEQVVDVPTEQDTFFSFQHDTFLFSSDLAIMKLALDRTSYDEEPGAPAPSRIREELDRLRKSWLISSVLIDSPRLDLKAAIMGWLESEDEQALLSAEELSWLDSSFERATSGIGFVGDALAFRLEIMGLSESDVQEVSEGLELIMGRFAESLAEEDLQMAFEVNAGTSSIRVNVNLEDLGQWLKKRLESIDIDNPEAAIVEIEAEQE